ncbi:hypothetical protein LUZ62_085486 [Rhynchospora pubera]|uniref:TLC domain-containing protein n=1 Tax=Rhynchospora pubera TaxID=906938 RepID=A0AAV8C6S8_9POAL|nr:hypothetical protein LUZ62_085486 [Rhynchospora pubera]
MDQNPSQKEQIMLPFSVVSGILMCKTVYDITGKVSSQLYKGYNGLKTKDKIEWNNRGFSTFHSLVVTVVSFYLVFISDIFKEDPHNPVTLTERKSHLSSSLQGISLGYFIADFAMIVWFFPSLGGMEYVLHHLLAIFSISLTLTSGKGHLYVHTLLLTEATTPFVNLRWYLDLAGKKSSTLYLYNGLAMFFGWLVARILLFAYFFPHLYFHFDEVKNTFPLGPYPLVTVPSVLALMNLFWFSKILKGAIKTLAKTKNC